MYIDSQVLEAQLDQVVSALGAPAPGTEPRCPRCNTALSLIELDEVRARVPAYVLQQHRRFRQCRTCDKVYWPGSHWQNVQSIVEPLLDGQDHDESQLGKKHG
jgi:uncharacterized protein with PIN domain